MRLSLNGLTKLRRSILLLKMFEFEKIDDWNLFTQIWSMINQPYLKKCFGAYTLFFYKKPVYKKQGLKSPSS